VKKLFQSGTPEVRQFARWFSSGLRKWVGEKGVSVWDSGSKTVCKVVQFRIAEAVSTGVL
jgi:hypothetical protein